MKSILFSALIFISKSQAMDISLNARIDPKNSFIESRAEIIFSPRGNVRIFFLNKNLEINSFEGAKIEKLDENRLSSIYHGDYPPLAQAYLISDISPRIKLNYRGMINHGMKEIVQEYSRSFSESDGIISSSGVYLSGSSYFYPYFPDQQISFRAELSLPGDFSCIMPGNRLKKGKSFEIWQERHPVDEITVSCGKFKEYSMKDGARIYYAFLLKDDEPLARQYLETAKKFVNFYSSLLGAYPYSKFAMVENFWETGYGLPSFTLLGSKVIRMPFILSSSFPHEILHNWWGNGVFVDYSFGNWCEGLTVYLADYLIKEDKNKGREYRRDILKKYSDYVKGSKDFPLKNFISRHSSAQEAVGYGKSMMFYHMLRLKLGDEVFLNGLRYFYSANIFKKASFNDLRASFEKVSGMDLKAFFEQWLEREGAMELELENPEISENKGVYSVNFTLKQKGPFIYEGIKVPAVFYFENEMVKKYIDFSVSSQSFSFSFAQKPSAMAVDPDFEVFRKLSPLETPPALSMVLGQEGPNIVLPCSSPDIKEYSELAETWSLHKENRPIVSNDCSLSAPPSNASAWYLGGKNKFAPLLSGYLDQYGASLNEKYFFDGKDTYDISSKTVVMAFYDHFNPSISAAYIISNSPKTLKKAASKLPHYSKYSWLIFDENGNNYKTGTWDREISNLKKEFSAAAVKYAYSSKPLAEIPSFISKENLEKHIEKLSVEIKERFPGSRGFQEAADYVVHNLKKYGLKPFYADYKSEFELTTGSAAIKTFNIVSQIEGRNKNEFVVICAHIDHLKSEGSVYYPGANDNASGAALVLELARYYSKKQPYRTLIFAFFSAEEEGRLGSIEFLKNFKDKDKINAALNFDTIGRLKKGKIIILNSSSSDKWQHIFRGAGFITQNDYELALQQLDSSDQTSFIEKGVPAVQFFSGPDETYHKPSDTADTINYKGIMNIAEIARETIDYLSSDSDFITRPVSQNAVSNQAGRPAKRKAYSGLTPDFSYNEKGVKALDIAAGSPLDKAGVKPGDIIISLNAAEISGLKDYSEALKKLNPQDTVKIKYLSSGIEKEAEIKLEENR